MNESGNFKKPNKKEEINQFDERINDLKGQINMLKMLFSMNLPIEKIKEHKKELQNLDEILKTYNEKLPKEIMEDKNSQKIIGFYNEIIERLKKFETMEDLKKILEDTKKFQDEK